MDLKTFTNTEYNELKKKQNELVKSYNASRTKASKKKLWTEIENIEIKLQK